MPPLILDRRMHLSPKNPYFEHATYSSWVAYRDGKPVGRISAQIDQLHLEQYQDATVGDDGDVSGEFEEEGGFDG